VAQAIYILLTYRKMKPSEAHLWYSSRRELLPASGRNRLALSSFTRALAAPDARRLWTRGTQMVSSPYLQITQPNGLDNVLRLPASARVVLDLPSLTADETQRWQHELDALLQRTCGCNEAAASLLIVLGGLAVLAYVFSNTVRGAPVLSIATAVGSALLGIAGGKAFGKLRGQRRLATLLRRLRARLIDRALDRGVG